MNDLLTYHIPETVRIHVQAVTENGQPLLDNNNKPLVLNQLNVDPQITNFTVLESIIVKAFNLNGDYILNYLNRSSNQYVQLKSDWDLENAYLGNAKPYLEIKVQKINVSQSLANEDWDIITTSELNRVATYAGKQTSQLANNFLNKMEKMVFKAFNKPQFDEDLDVNCNVTENNPNGQNQNEVVEKRKSNFDAFSLFKFKRRSNNESINQQVIDASTNQPQNTQQSKNRLTVNSNNSLSPNLSSSNLSNQKQKNLNPNNLNLSTNSIKSSKYSFTKRDLGKKLTIKKKDIKNATNRIKKISSVQGDNLILQSILGKVSTNIKTNQYEPLTEQQYLKYLHPDGRIRCLREFRLAVYRRGVESSLRSTVWKHLLNVYPSGMTSEQRVRFVQQKADQYHQLCFTWQRNFSHPKVQQIHNQVRKDVLRTDRSHPFYVSKVNLDTEQQNDITSSVSTYSSILTQFDYLKTNESSMNSSYTTNDYSTDATGIDNQVANGVYENRNVQALTNVLTTYALNHKIGYWQFSIGMSDLCSPILLAIQNEADTYICFTALMRRLSANFNGDECMANKFELLRSLVQHYDPEFYNYLEQQQASDLLFCYRWLLLELKREFKLDNALYMLEVSWAAMPAQFYPDLPMYNKKFVPTEDEIKTEIKIEPKKNELKTVDEKSSIKMQIKNESPKDKSSPKPVTVINQQRKTSELMDTESVNSSKTLSNSLSFKNNHLNKFKESTNVQDNIKNLKNEMTDLGKQITNLSVNGVNHLKKSVNEVANVASEFYDKFNHQANEHRSTVRSTLKDLKLSSVEEKLACKREKFHQQNTTGHSVNSLSDMRFSLDRDVEQKKSKNSSLNGSNHSLIEYNNTLNYILNKTQAMLKQQEQKFSNHFNFNLNGGKDNSKEYMNNKEGNKENRELNKCSTNKQHRHIRFLPKILSTDSNNAIDSPENDDLNEKLNFPYLMNKQFSIDSVDSLEFNLQQENNNFSSTNFITSSSFFKPTSNRSTNQSGGFNNNFTYFTNFNNLPSFTNNLPFTKQNSIPQANLLKQQLKQSFNQQNHIYHLKQRSLPSSPLFKKKLDSFERPFLPFLQNVTNILDKHMFVAEQPHSSSLNNSTNSQKLSSIYSTVTNNNYMPTTNLSNRTNKRSKLISNQFDSFDQRDLFVHCNGENETTSSSNYNSNWKPERGLLNCFDSASFDASNNVCNNNILINTSNGSHQRLARQLSDKLINEKMHQNSARQSSCEERTMDGKRLLSHTQSANPAAYQSSNEFRTLTGQLNKLNLNTNNHLMNEPQDTMINPNELANDNQYLKANSTNSSNTTYEKEEKSEGYCSGSISDRNSNYEEQCTNLDNELALTNTFSNSTSSLKSSHSTSSSSSSISSSLSCSSSLVILSSNTSFRTKIAQIEKLSGCLPSPNELSTGNAFMLFICLTIILLHRDKIINENLDANDIAIYFDSKVRKHDVNLVVNLARELFAVYLNRWQGFQLANEVADQSILDSYVDGHTDN